MVVFVLVRGIVTSVWEHWTDPYFTWHTRALYESGLAKIPSVRALYDLVYFDTIAPIEDAMVHWLMPHPERVSEASTAVVKQRAEEGTCALQAVAGFIAMAAIMGMRVLSA